ncbi:hypothetical protein ACIBQ1_09805 [Nonomuraea sp. NPDC050153]|uniref:hypothetical protein n=1 Tax=Nonomuraea sp. NPDC050153 TaxID=3364359 RepID=UPI0037A6833E
MAIVEQYLAPEEAAFRTGLAFPQMVRVEGTNQPVTGLAFDGAGTTSEYAFWKFSPFKYGSGNLSVDVIWYAASGTSGTVDWAAGVACITPNTDTEDVQSAGFGSSPLATGTHLGTTARRLHKTTITITDTDSMAAGDECWLRLARNPSTDSITADVIVTSVRLSYSDT